MSIILLADDSPHALRMGERILQEEGYQVVSITDGDTAMLRMADVDPDLVIADAFLPGRGGFELCRYIKTHHRHTRVILTAGLLERLDESAARQSGCDAILRKPFEASVVMPTIRPLELEARLVGALPRAQLRAARDGQLDGEADVRLEEVGRPERGADDAADGRLLARVEEDRARAATARCCSRYGHVVGAVVADDGEARADLDLVVDEEADVVLRLVAAPGTSSRPT